MNSYGIKSTVTLNKGVELPRFGLGVWQVENSNVMHAAIKAALDAGYIHIDTAQAYENEDMVGESLTQLNAREKVFITTKLANPNQGDPYNAFEQSLKKLKTDYVDLFLMHWPSPWRGKYIDAWKAMVEIQNSGKAKAIGVSNFKPAHLEKIISATGVTPAVNQVERHPLFQQEELAEHCRGLGIVMEAYSPLGGAGRLPDIAPLVAPIAQKHRKTAAQVILRWHLETDWVVIPKSANPARIAENADIFDFALDGEDLAAIKALDANRRFLPDADEAQF